MVLNKEQIIERLNSLHEHTMAKDIFAPLLKKMNMLGVKFTGGSDEHGIDIEYYELTQPEKNKSYVGIQFKKGDLVCKSSGAKNSVREVKNQAEEAFEKEIHDLESRSTRYISRFIVATTGNINENARTYIGKARQKGQDRRIDYWDGDHLSEYIQNHWMHEFTSYFKISVQDDLTTEKVVSIKYIEENYSDLVRKSRQVKRSIDSNQWKIIKALLNQLMCNDNDSIPLSDILMELGRSADFYDEEINNLFRLKYLTEDDSNFSLDGNAKLILNLYHTIVEELQESEEDLEKASAMLFELID